MVEYANMVFHERQNGFRSDRTVKMKRKKNIRVQLMTDIVQFTKIQEFMHDKENVYDCNNESQACYKIIDRYFYLIDEIDKWKKIALSEINKHREDEKKQWELERNEKLKV